MPTGTRVLLINGVNTGISYPITNNDIVDNTTQPQEDQISAQQQLDDDSNDKRSITSSTDDGPSTKRHKSREEDRTDDTPTCFSVAHPRDSQYLSPRQCYFRSNCIEYFVVSEDFKPKGPTGTVKKGRVGVRCIFCKNVSLSERAPQHSSFPNKISSIYSCHTMIELRHIKECKHVPKIVRDELEKAKHTKQHTGAAKQFYEASARDRGLVDTAKGVFRSKDVGNVDEFSSSSQLSTKKKKKKSKMRVTAAAAAAAAVSTTATRKGLRSDEDYTDEYSDTYSPPLKKGRQIPQEDWTEEHDLRLWNGQNQMGNIWQNMADKIFKGEWHSDKIRNRWYSQPFKDFIASKFGENAYKEAQAKGKQINSGGRVSLSGKKRGRDDGPLIVWTSDTDNKLWKAQNELGNRWREVAVKLGRPNNLDQIKSRWYSDKFKDFVAREFGKGAYKEAHVAGKQQRTGAKPQIDWTEEDDKLLWQSRLELGNKWGDISSIKFENRITENLVKNRWYSTAFKNFVASVYGPNAYEQAKISRRGPTCQVTWTEEDDAMLWKLHQEIGNKWDEMEDRYFKEQNITETQVKNRWYSQPFKRYVAQNFGQDAHENC